MKARVLLLGIALLLLLPATAEARRVRIRPRYHASFHPALFLAPGNYYVGAGLVATSILDQTGVAEELDDGAGMTAWFGLKASDRLSLELGWMGSFHNPTSSYDGGCSSACTAYTVLEALTADARIHLDESSGVVPFLQGGVGFYFLGEERPGFERVGTGFQLGGGFDYFFGEHLSIGARALYRGIALSPPESVAEDTFISAATLEGTINLIF